eukprot:649248-Prorocentrum_minimum.AAC.1
MTQHPRYILLYLCKDLFSEGVWLGLIGAAAAQCGCQPGQGGPEGVHSAHPRRRPRPQARDQAARQHRAVPKTQTVEERGRRRRQVCDHGVDKTTTFNFSRLSSSGGGLVASGCEVGLWGGVEERRRRGRREGEERWGGEESVGFRFLGFWGLGEG